MDRQILNFREVIAPIPAERFFADVYRRKPLHVPGPDDKFAAFFGWTAMNELLSMSSLWTDQTCELTIEGKGLTHNHYCYSSIDRDNSKAWLIDADRVLGYLQQGATLTLNFIERLTPPLRSLSQTLAATCGASVNCSTFLSWPNAKGYASHFDTTQVFVLQVAGRKRWNIYEGRMQTAAHTASAKSKYLDFPQSHHEKAKGRVLQEVEMTPGDLLYIPHGQYHDAVAGPEPTIHLSFAVRHLVIQDFINALTSDLPQNPFFLQHLPGLGDASGNQAVRKQTAEVLQKVLAEPAVGQGLEALLRSKAFERFQDFRLPERRKVQHFCVNWLGKRLSRENGALRLVTQNRAVPLEGTASEIAPWAIEKDYLADTWVEEDFPHMDETSRRSGLDSLCRAGLLTPV